MGSLPRVSVFSDTGPLRCLSLETAVRNRLALL